MYLALGFSSLWCSVKFTSVLPCFNKISVLPRSTNMWASALWTLSEDWVNCNRTELKFWHCPYSHVNYALITITPPLAGIIAQIADAPCIKFYVIYSKLSDTNLNNSGLSISVFDGVHALTGSNYSVLVIHWLRVLQAQPLGDRLCPATTCNWSKQQKDSNAMLSLTITISWLHGHAILFLL